MRGHMRHYRQRWAEMEEEEEEEMEEEEEEQQRFHCTLEVGGSKTESFP